MDWSYVAGYFDGEGNVRFKAAPSRPDYVLIGLMWSNTHLASLEAIRQFIGCGIIRHRKPKARLDGTAYVPGHQLNVERVADIVRVSEQMLPHLMIKRAKVEEMLHWARTHRTSAPITWGRVSEVGEQEIRRLYWDEGLTHQQIANRLGVTRNAVGVYMARHRIGSRSTGPRPKNG